MTFENFLEWTPSLSISIQLVGLTINFVGEAWLLRRDLLTLQASPLEVRKKSADIVAWIPGLYLVIFLWGLLFLGILGFFLSELGEWIAYEVGDLVVAVLTLVLVVAIGAPLFFTFDNLAKRFSRRLGAMALSVMKVREGREDSRQLVDRWLERGSQGAILFSYLLFFPAIYDFALAGAAFAVAAMIHRRQFRKKQLASLVA